MIEKSVHLTVPKGEENTGNPVRTPGPCRSGFMGQYLGHIYGMLGGPCTLGSNSSWCYSSELAPVYLGQDLQVFWCNLRSANMESGVLEVSVEH